MVKIPKNKIIVALGVLVALLPLLGFPRAWEAFFQVSTGSAIILLSIWATIDKKITLRAKAERRRAEKALLRDAMSQENVPPEIQGGEI